MKRKRTAQGVPYAVELQRRKQAELQAYADENGQPQHAAKAGGIHE